MKLHQMINYKTVFLQHMLNYSICSQSPYIAWPTCPLPSHHFGICHCLHSCMILKSARY